MRVRTTTHDHGLKTRVTKSVSGKAALNDRAREIWKMASERLRAMLDPALGLMEEQLADRFQPTRFRAAATILRLANLSKAAPRDLHDV